jgi:hypothetical protein
VKERELYRNTAKEAVCEYVSVQRVRSVGKRDFIHQTCGEPGHI